MKTTLVPYSLCLAALLASSASQAGIIPIANETIQLSANGVQPNTASIAYDPNYGLYYGSRAGNSSYTAAVWDALGTQQQSLSPMGADARGWNYNSNTGQLELVTFTSDLLTVGRNGSGLLTGSYTTQLSNMSGSPSTQSMFSYNPLMDVFYAMTSGPIINVIDHGTGALDGTISLDFAAAGITSLNAWFIGYDELEDALIGTSGDSAYVFSTSGDFLGSSQLGFNPDTNFDAGYANGQLFVYSDQVGGFQGYDLFDTVYNGGGGDLPEPGSVALFGLALAGLGYARRQRR